MAIIAMLFVQPGEGHVHGEEKDRGCQKLGWKY